MNVCVSDVSVGRCIKKCVEWRTVYFSEWLATKNWLYFAWCDGTAHPHSTISTQERDTGMTEDELEYNGNYDEACEELQEYYEEEEGGEGEWDGDEEDAVQVGDEIELVSLDIQLPQWTPIAIQKLGTLTPGFFIFAVFSRHMRKFGTIVPWSRRGTQPSNNTRWAARPFTYTLLEQEDKQTDMYGRCFCHRCITASPRKRSSPSMYCYFHPISDMFCVWWPTFHCYHLI